MGTADRLSKPQRSRTPQGQGGPVQPHRCPHHLRTAPQAGGVLHLPRVHGTPAHCGRAAATPQSSHSRLSMGHPRAPQRSCSGTIPTCRFTETFLLQFRPTELEPSSSRRRRSCCYSAYVPGLLAVRSKQPPSCLRGCPLASFLVFVFKTHKSYFSTDSLCYRISLLLRNKTADYIFQKGANG